MKISIGLGGIVFIVLFAMKLAGAIEMGWFWVLTSAIWVPFLVLLAELVIVFVLGTIIVSVLAWISK